jgi:hypothetical protein
MTLKEPDDRVDKVSEEDGEAKNPDDRPGDISTRKHEQEQQYGQQNVRGAAVGKGHDLPPAK